MLFVFVPTTYWESTKDVCTLPLLVRLGIDHAQHFMMRSLEVVTSQSGTDVQTTPTDEILFTGAARIKGRSYPVFLQVVSTWTTEEFQHFNRGMGSGILYPSTP